MTLAEIHGKSPLSHSEDLLTANVFTAFRYLPPEHGLLGFLRAIPGLTESLSDSNLSRAAIHFWPLGLRANREPDVLLELEFDDHTLHVVIEAKYLSGASDTGDFEMQLGESTFNAGKQLVGQYVDLIEGDYRIFEASMRDRHISLASAHADRYLIYLTAHPVRPEVEIDGILADHPEMDGQLFWASWYHASEHFQNLQPVLTEFPYNRVLADICLLLERKGFFTFHGVNPPPSIRWKYGETVFWQDVRLGWVLFTGIARPPEVHPEMTPYIFWDPHQNGDSHE